MFCVLCLLQLFKIDLPISTKITSYAPRQPHDWLVKKYGKKYGQINPVNY